MDDSLTLPGYLENEIIKIGNSGAGQVKQVYVTRGDSVKKNQLLFSLEDQQQRQQLAYAAATYKQALSTLRDYVRGSAIEDILQTEAELQSVKLQHALSLKTLKRLESLKTKQFVSETAWDEALNNEAVLRTQQQQVQAKLNKLYSPLRTDQISLLQATTEAAMAKYRQAQWHLDQQKLLAPSDGVIDDVYFKAGEFVATGQSVLSFRQKKLATLVFYLPYAHLNSVQIGSEIDVSCAACDGKTYPAIVRYIAAEPEFTPPIVYGGEFNSKYVYQIKAQLIDKTPLHPGQAVDISIRR